jgi:hypothetical protein
MHKIFTLCKLNIPANYWLERLAFIGSFRHSFTLVVTPQIRRNNDTRIFNFHGSPITSFSVTDLSLGIWGSGDLHGQSCGLPQPIWTREICFHCTSKTGKLSIVLPIQNVISNPRISPTDHWRLFFLHNANLNCS